ncbi:putative heterokaryon incompatibility protein R [Rosellinia necatrix]|uniref:Putative heterokaryon incompatibility protein R n=1 Tax=Rosellinia necatrix TaxID=77044 RepID=A0A1W2TCR9_ROSNE|nr:putative heterokaryon incompatibility protein R [Rosellinia necatrix]
MSTQVDQGEPHKRPGGGESTTSKAGESQKGSSDQPSVASSEISNFLWDEVYETLQTENPGLISWFETISSSNLQPTVPGIPLQAPLSEVNDSPINQSPSQTRRSNMENILNLWLEKIAETKRKYWCAGDGVAAELGALLRDIVCDCAESAPDDATLVWAVAGYAAENLFLRRTRATERHRQGVLYIISRLEWYCCLPKMTLGEAAVEGDNRQQPQPKLREAILSLYQAVFSYLVATACVHFSDRDLSVSNETISSALEIRRRGIEAVKAAERVLPLFNRVHVKDRLESLLSTASEDLESRAPQCEPVNEGDGDEKLPDSKWRRELLEKLGGIADPRHNIHQLPMHDKDDLLSEFYDPLLSSTVYRPFFDWEKADDVNRLLCISGGPGQGTTILLTSMVQALLTGKVHPGLRDPRRLSFFFFNHNRPHENHPATALRSLIWLILEAQPELARHLTNQLALTNRDALHHPTDFPALSAVFCNMIEDGEFKETYLVVGALDQCFNNEGSNWPGIKEFLFIIVQSLALSDKIRWLVSFESGRDCDDAFRNSLIWKTEEKKRCLHLDLKSNVAGSCFSHMHYIQTSVRELAKEKRYDDELERCTSEKLFEQSSPNYSCVDTVCAVLRADQAFRAGRVVGLLELYEYISRELINLPGRDDLICTRVISTVALLHEPIRVDELVYILDINRPMDINDILRKCSAFLRDIGGQIWFLHPFAEAFSREHIVHHLDVPKLYSSITRRCLDYLGSILAGGSRVETTTASYSLLHWITHLDQVWCPSKDTGIQETLHWFLANHFLRWIKQLVIHGQLSTAAAKLQKIHLRLAGAAGTTPRDLTDMNVSPRATLQVMIRDMLHFIHVRQSTQAPRVPVCNTLVFCRERSLIRKLWVAETLPGLSPRAPVDRYWERDSRVFRGHAGRVRSVAFSPNGRLLASGADDGTVRIWDVETGETQHTLLTGGGWVHSVAFSHQRWTSQGGMVAAGAETSVTLWDANTGRLLHTLDYHSSVNSVAFSVDARSLAVASGLTVDILDISGLNDNAKLSDTGRKFPFETIHHRQIVRSVVFSRHGRLLATGTDDPKVRVWRVNSIYSEGLSEKMIAWVRKNAPRIEGLDKAQDVGTEIQSSVSDGANNANKHSESDGERTKPNTADLIYTLEGHDNSINDVAFSGDSELIASCSADGTCKIWPIGRDKLGPHYTLSSGPINSVSFLQLPWGVESLLAISILDRIEVWDVETGHQVGSATSRSSRPLSRLAFSPDGSFIASGCDRGDVHAWHATNWELESDEISTEGPPGKGAAGEAPARMAKPQQRPVRTAKRWNRTHSENRERRRRARQTTER